MALVTLEEILKQLNPFLPEEATEESLALLENISDSVASSGGYEAELEKLRGRVKSLEAEKEKMDADWRKRYRDRFYGEGEEPASIVEAKALDEPEVEVVKSVEEAAEEWQE